MITPKEAERIARVLDCVDPASDCAVGNDEIDAVREIIERETSKIGFNHCLTVNYDIADMPEPKFHTLLTKALNLGKGIRCVFNVTDPDGD